MLIAVVIDTVTAAVSLKPTDSLPGTKQAQDVVNGLAFLALVVCLGALVAGGATWAVSNWTNNSHYASKGKTGTLVALGGAFLIAAAAALINYATGLGGAVK